METLNNLDEQLFLFFNKYGNPAWDQFWIIATDYWLAFPLYILLAWLIYRKTGFLSAFTTLSTIVLSVVVIYGFSRLIKYGVLRPRPCNPESGLKNVYYPLSEECGNFGFFSTHASVAMTLVYFAGKVLKPYYKYIFWFLGIWVFIFCYSRIYVGKHYPGDLIVGLLVGYIFGLIFYQLRKKIEKRFYI